MKVLVTGGAGYLGSIISNKLLEFGYDVTIYDRFMFGVDSILHFISNKRLNIIEGDIRDSDKLKSAISGVDGVIHLAAIVGYPACTKDPILARTTNVNGTKNVIKYMSPGQFIIFASTGSTYGKVDSICTEETPINPLTLYGETKAEAEKTVVDFGGVALRFATVFGCSPRIRLDLLVNDFVYKAVHEKQIVLYEGYFKRTFLHSTDAVRSIIFAINNYSKMRARPFNIGDETMNYTKLQVAEEIKKQTDYFLYSADIGEDKDKRDYEVSYEKIKDLGFLANINLENGIKELLKVTPHIHIQNKWRNV